MMKWGLILRVLVTVVVLGCAAYPFLESLHPAGVLPFNVEHVEGDKLAGQVEVREGIDLPAGLQVGDRLDFRDQPLVTRAMYDARRIRAGSTYVFKVVRDGKPLSLTVAAVPRSADKDLSLGVQLYHSLVLVLLLVLGLATLWWGRDWTAWGFSLFANLVIVSIALHRPMAPWAAAIADLVYTWAILPFTLAGFYFAAWAFAQGTLSGSARRHHHRVYLLALMVYLAGQASAVGTILGWWTNPLGDWAVYFVVPYAVWILIPVEVLLLAYRRADASRRSSLRWLVWSVALFLGATVGAGLGWMLPDAYSGVLRTVCSAVMALALAGLLYGILVRRVIPLSFFVHRGLVYGLTLAIVVLVFAAVEVLLVQTTLGKGASFVLTVLVSMGVALMLDQIHGRTGSFIERLLFRRRHIAVTKLKDFARHSAFMEDRTRLLDEAVDLVFTHMQPAGVAIYERAGDGYRCIRQKGAAFAEHVQIDDRAFVSLRAGSRRADLDGMTSDLGAHGHAFPMAVRGVLQGALVCGGRAERYTVDELDLMATVAHEVGIAHHVLHSRDSEALLNGLADGSIGPNAALESARKLLRLDPPRQLPE